MDTVQNVAAFTFSLADGRVLLPGSDPVTDVDMTHPDNQALKESGVLLVFDPVEEPLEKKKVPELRKIAAELDIDPQGLDREQLLERITQARTSQEATS